MGEKARYYKCALQVNSCTYAKFRGHSPQDESDYNEQILEHCKANNITVVGLADHGSVDASSSLRTFLSDAGIVVFPGFEIASAEKIHMVCLFPPEYDNSKLNRIIGSLGLTQAEKGTEASEEPCLRIAQKVKDNGGFWYAAHILGDNGILKIGKTQNIWVDESLVAAQIPASRDEIHPDYLNIVNNRDPNYKRKHSLAYINASDIEVPEDLDKDNASVLIKMSSPNFNNFCMAFKDPDSRIRLNYERENNYQSSIDKIIISGGYLDGLNVDISENLATLIGGRGTGKSTLIGIIRYALDKEPIGRSAVKDFKEMLDQNLGSGSVVELHVTSNTQHGQKFIIKRRYKQPPVITTPSGKVSPLKVDEILPTIEIYGQNEIMEIANDPLRIRDVADRLLDVSSDTLVCLDKAYTALVENGSQITDLESQLQSADSSLDDLPSIEARLEYYEKAGLKDKLSLFKTLSTEEGQFNALKKSIPEKTASLPTINVGTYENPELVALSENIKDFNQQVDALNKQYASLLSDLKQSYSKHKTQWESNREQYDAQLKHSLKTMDGIQDKSSQEIVKEYSDLIRTSEECKPLVQKRKHIEEQLEAAQKARIDLIEEYKSACDERDKQLSKCVKKINRKKLNGIVEISIKYRQNKQPLLEFLDKSISGVGEKSLAGIAEYEDFDVFTFADDCRTEKDQLKTKYNLTSGTASKIIETLTKENLREIEEMQLSDIVEIKLNVGPRYKRLKELSKGQQCTAILNLLLLDNKDPLIIDQPEDNLDNSFIAANLVQTLRANKIKRQYIFATHNANIPVFGDAEQIITMEENDGFGHIADDGLGSIDDANVKAKVISILEGGKDAFKMREAKYDI